MESTPIAQLCGCKIKQPFPGSFRHHVDETKQVLGRIPESHSTPNSAFKIGRRTAHVKCDHALIGIPDVHHTVGIYIRSIDTELLKQQIPVFF